MTGALAWQFVYLQPTAINCFSDFSDFAPFKPRCLLLLDWGNFNTACSLAKINRGFYKLLGVGEWLLLVGEWKIKSGTSITRLCRVFSLMEGLVLFLFFIRF
uniref:USG protein n=1 Tax=Cucumis sativus TaxID=3659 RepID=A0A0A0KUC9_CUCSA